MNTNTKISAYSVQISLSILDETILLLAYSLGQLDMLLKEHYDTVAYEVTSITLLNEYDKIITPQLN